MVDVLSPFTITPPPPPSFSSSKNTSMPMLYYGLVVVGTTAIVLTLYNLIIIKRCNRRHTQSQDTGPHGLVEGVPQNRSFENPQRNLLSSFKYKKELVVAKEEDQEEQRGDGDDYECPVCLSVYEEGEEVRKLPRCKHSFHAICIDMWLYSHFDCPICRTPVGPFFHPFPADNYRHVLMESGGISV
ncbi:RING-H2 finger protein ATL1-like [Gastrolobium bilobum]|uniref:RING-H2 finger protein ATL1-like n=1 Tax=Gastrolobium bilobum TaxID=150636 RepID=UPI002AB193F6|nr:RING-H2 finger protein ATL1-like [Gastrolobium bilobum]